MRRFPHGGSSRPPFARPGNGYGRSSTSRPGPLLAVEAAPLPEPGQFCAPVPTPVLVWEVASNNRPVIAWSEGPTEHVAHRAAAPSPLGPVPAARRGAPGVSPSGPRARAPR